MTVIELAQFLQQQLANPVYPLQFPMKTSNENIAVVDIINGEDVGVVLTRNFQLMYRSKHPATAQALATSQYHILHNMTRKVYNNWEIILVQSTQPTPYMEGQDTDLHFIYTVDYKIIVSKIN